MQLRDSGGRQKLLKKPQPLTVPRSNVNTVPGVVSDPKNSGWTS